MDEKAKISLTPEQETLLIPLYTKAQPDNPIFYDPASREILQKVDYDFSKLRIPYKTTILICQRAKKIDAVTKTFLSKNPAGIVLHLGCGLDSRFWRVDNGQVAWYDLDMPPVVTLRQQFFPPVERYHLIASSVTELAWIDQVVHSSRPALVIAEGLLMYLKETDVKRLFLRLQETFPGCRLVGDVFSELAARSATRHPSLRKTGASLGWGLDDAREVEGWALGIRLLEEWCFSQDPDLARLSWGYRLAYKLAGSFRAARLAQRIVYYQL